MTPKTPMTDPNVVKYPLRLGILFHTVSTVKAKFWKKTEKTTWVELPTTKFRTWLKAYSLQPPVITRNSLQNMTSHVVEKVL